MAKPKKDLRASGLDELRKDIQGRTFRRVYLLYGSEDYLAAQYRRELINAVCGDNTTMNLNIHRNDVLNWGQLQDEILSMPFFAEYRMVVLDDTKLFRPKRKASDGEDGADENVSESGSAGGNSSSEKGDEDFGGDEEDTSALAAEIAAFLPNVPETCVLLFTELPDEVKPNGQKGKVSVDKRSKLYKAVSKYGLAVELVPPDDTMLRKWITGRFSAEKIRITNGAIDTFMQMVGTNMSHISTETEKLISYTGRGGEIRREDVIAVTSELLEGKIFRMLDLISQHDRKGALALYDDLLQLKEAPPKILIMLIKQIDKLLLARSILDAHGSSVQVAEAIGQPKWAADSVIRQARGFTTSELREAVEEGLKMQQKAQSGQIDYRLGLELLILRFTA